jgi:hypothetical protein
MKKTSFLLLLLMAGCTASRPRVADTTVFRNHPPPFKVFSVGRWSAGNEVLTLIDARNNYFIIITPRKQPLKKGDNYQP